MKLEGRRILVTGADGFIGSHLVEHRVAPGHEMTAFVRCKSVAPRGWLDESAESLPRSIEVTSGDIRERFNRPGHGVSPLRSPDPLGRDANSCRERDASLPC